MTGIARARRGFEDSSTVSHDTRAISVRSWDDEVNDDCVRRCFAWEVGERFIGCHGGMGARAASRACGAVVSDVEVVRRRVCCLGGFGGKRAAIRTAIVSWVRE